MFLSGNSFSVPNFQGWSLSSNLILLHEINLESQIKLVIEWCVDVCHNRFRNLSRPIYLGWRVDQTGRFATLVVKVESVLGVQNVNQQEEKHILTIHTLK